MKLRNKKTGEVKEVIVGGYPVSGETEIWECAEMNDNGETGYTTLGAYSSLAELNEEWEDAPEKPKNYWHVDFDGSLMQTSNIKCDKNVFDKLKEIGNYFETKEEAEKAVEKLKAWKRLKDYYIKFKLDFVKNTISFTYRIDGTLHSSVDEQRIIFEDMKTIFGGEE